MKFEVFCISGVSAVDRRTRVTVSAARYGWTLKFFPAVYPPKNHEEFAVFKRSLRHRFHDFLNVGEVGCALSHLVLWDDLARSECDFFVIFEDDARFIAGPERLQYYKEADLQMLNSRSNAHEGSIFLGANSGGTDGYLITREGARKALPLLAEVKAPLDISILMNSRLFGGPLVVLVLDRIVEHDESSVSEIGTSRVLYSNYPV